MSTLIICNNIITAPYLTVVFPFRLHIKQEVGRDDCKAGVMAMPMPPLPPPLSGGVQQQVTDLDKKLMPPPPPPPTSHDRGQPERKKAKGALGSVAGLSHTHRMM